MERYIGIDVGTRTSAVGVVGPSGRRLHAEVVETSAPALIASIQRVPGHKYLCLEEGQQSEWLYEVLSPHVDELVVTVPREKKPGDRCKSDIEDSYQRAEDLRRGAIDKRIYKPSAAFAQVRAALHLHTSLTQDVVRTKNRLRALFNSRGVLLDGDLYKAEPSGDDRLVRLLPVASRPVAVALLAELQAVSALQKQAEARLIEEAKKHRGYRWIVSAPGIGPIRAATILAIVVQPHRFRTSRQFWKYSGLALRTTATGQWLIKRGKPAQARAPLTRGLQPGNPLLKTAFKGAAMTITVKLADTPLGNHYRQLLARNLNEDLARVTLARKLAAIVLALWKNEEEYDPTKHFTFEE